MRCTKCGYISFDHNSICPKCKKDLKVVQSLLNLPDFNPSPPYLLGILIGGGNDSIVDLNTDLPAHMDEIEHEDFESEQDISFEMEEPESVEGIDKQGIAAFHEIEFGETESEEMDLEPLSDDELGLDKEVSLDLEDVSIEIGEEGSSSLHKGTQENLSLEEGPVSRPGIENQPLDVDMEGIVFDLEDISPERELTDKETPSELTGENDDDEFLIDVDQLSLEETKSRDQVEKPSYKKSELVTMEIDWKKVESTDDEEETE